MRRQVLPGEVRARASWEAVHTGHFEGPHSLDASAFQFEAACSLIDPVISSSDMLRTALVTIAFATSACNEREAGPTTAKTQSPRTPLAKAAATTPSSATSSSKTDAKPTVDEPVSGDANPTAAVERSKFDPSAVPKRLEVSGDISGGIRWRDANGDNVLVMSTVRRRRGILRSIYLRADHVVTDAEGVSRVLRTIRDHEERCDGDLFGKFIDESFAVTDLDEDRIGEVTFAYELGCMTDLSPKDLELLVLENGDKYVIRGATRIEFEGEGYGGEQHIDDSFDEAPNAFLAHAKAVWADIVVSRVP